MLAAFTRNGRFAVVEKARVRQYLSDHPQVQERLARLNDELRRYDLHFGYRVFDEIVMFMVNAGESGVLGEDEAFDAAVLMKVLPKFHGSRAKLEPALREVLAWCVNPDEPARAEIAEAISEAQKEAVDAPPGDVAAEKLRSLAYQLPHTAERATRVLRAVYNEGFAAFG